jgi:hypothetical protein
MHPKNPSYLIIMNVPQPIYIFLPPVTLIVCPLT